MNVKLTNPFQCLSWGKQNKQKIWEKFSKEIKSKYFFYAPKGISKMDEEYPNSQIHLITSAQALSYPLRALLLQYLELSQEPV